MLENFHKKGVIEAGCDEAGRGCLAGPVFAAAVILPPDFQNDLLNDSKKLTEKQKQLLREFAEISGDIPEEQGSTLFDKIKRTIKGE